MEVIFSALKKKEVINLTDGKHLGKVCDVTFSYPQGVVAGVTVTGCKGFKFTKSEMFIPLKSVNKIGEDAVLVCLPQTPPQGGGTPPPPPAPPQPPQPPYFPPPGPQSRRSMDEYE